MWLWIFVLVLSGFSDSNPPPGGLYKEFKDTVILSKYAQTSKKIVAGILKAVQIFDCYDTKVRETRLTWTAGLELSTSAFDALRGLKTTEKEFTNTVSGSLVLLKELQTTLHAVPDIIGKIDVKNTSCYMGGFGYDKDDCQECRDSIPGFKSKAYTMSELREIVLSMQNTIPKQFLFYANDIFVVVAEAVRIIDKMWNCLESHGQQCESRDKSMVMFTRKLNEIARKENDHAKMVVMEKTKMKVIVAQLVQEVEGTMNAMARCLQFKEGISIFEQWKDEVFSVSSAANNAGVDLDKTKVTDTSKVVQSVFRDLISSTGSKVAKEERRAQAQWREAQRSAEDLLAKFKSTLQS